MRTRTLLPLLLLLLAGCPTEPTEERASEDPITLDEYIERETAERRIPGLALAISRNDTVLEQRGYGRADVGSDAPVTPETRFDLASLTKQFTAVGVMMLVEEGTVDLDASITNYLPDPPENWEPVTPRHLMTHTSGLPPIGQGFSGSETGIYSQAVISTERSYAAARADTLRAQPGERYDYSDVGYFLLGMITEQASGSSWRDFMRERIFEPLEMTKTFILDPAGAHDDVAQTYTLRGGELSILRRAWEFELPSHFGIYSTVGDLAKWDAALYTDQLLTEESRRAMWTPVELNNGSTHPYGFGWQVEELEGRRLLRHTGITGTEMVHLPDDGLVVIVLTNLGRGFGGTADSWGIAPEIARMTVSASAAEP